MQNIRKSKQLTRERKMNIYNMLQFSHEERKNKGPLIRTESAVARAAA
jgi:hypothetical protein